MFQVQRFSHNAIRRMAGIVVSFLLVGFCLAACGANTTTGGGNQPTPTQTQPAQAVNCGKVQNRANNIAPSDKTAAVQSVNCFYQAYQKCQPATLVYSSIGVDAGAIHNLSVKSANGSCTISDGWQHFVAPKPPSSIVTYSCTGMTMQSDGLHIESCGKAGTIVIPLT